MQRLPLPLVDLRHRSHHLQEFLANVEQLAFQVICTQLFVGQVFQSFEGKGTGRSGPVPIVPVHAAQVQHGETHGETFDGRGHHAQIQPQSCACGPRAQFLLIRELEWLYISRFIDFHLAGTVGHVQVALVVDGQFLCVGRHGQVGDVEALAVQRKKELGSGTHRQPVVQFAAITVGHFRKQVSGHAELTHVESTGSGSLLQELKGLPGHGQAVHATHIEFEGMESVGFMEAIGEDRGIEVALLPAVLRQFPGKDFGRNGGMETGHQNIVFGEQERPGPHVVLDIVVYLTHAEEIVIPDKGRVILIRQVVVAKEETFLERLGVQAQGGSHEGRQRKDHSLTHGYRRLCRRGGLRKPI